MKYVNNELIYNMDYVSFIPSSEEYLFESVSYSIGNTFLFDNSLDYVKKAIEFVQYNKIKKVIFIDYLMEYMNVIDKLPKDVKIEFVFTKQLSGLSNYDFYIIFENIIKLYDTKKIKSLSVLDYGAYLCLKAKGMKVYHIILDIPNSENCLEKNNTIGILNRDYDPCYSYYNELSAVKLMSNKITVKVPCLSDTSKNFLKDFDIDYIESTDIDSNILNMYINFTNYLNDYFLKSMDMGIPCLLGNTDILDEYPKLKKYLVLESDDDINEIASKADLAIKDSKDIIKEYEKFRKEYSKKSKDSIKESLNIEIKHNKDNSELLLSVIVPVYNTEKYLKDCLDSIIASRIDSMEILVINDGSTDNSEEIINTYVKKYPDLIRYIKQKNGGLGHVRNVGLKELKGKYFASIDSDDTINKDFFKESIAAMRNDVDIIMCDWLSIVEKDNNSFLTSASDWCFRERRTYESLLYTTIMPSTCNKIFKRTLFDNTVFEYAEGLKYEDLSINPTIMLRAKTIKYINKPYYEYKIRANSIMRSSVGYHMIDIIKMLDGRINSTTANSNIDIEELKYYTYSWRIEESVINQLYNLEGKELDDFISYMNSNLKDVLKELYNSKYYKSKLSEYKEEYKEYVTERNKAILNNKVNEFILKVKGNENYLELTPCQIYYGFDN